jgi:hypothetical protein
MVYFNNLNDLKKLQSALIEQKRKLADSSIENSQQNQSDIETVDEISKKKIKNI